MSISALIIARDEQDRISKALESLDFVDEIVVILDRSKDKTNIIASKFTKQIHEGAWESEGSRRNFGISKCNSEWIIEIDADEVVNKRLAKEIRDKIARSSDDLYYIHLTNYIGKKKITNGWMACLAPDGKFCLFKKGKKKWIKGSVHPTYSINGSKGSKFKEPILHFMSKNISDLINRLYTLDGLSPC